MRGEVKMKRDAAHLKQERMRKIASYVAPMLAEGQKVRITKLLAWIEINIGLTKDKAGEYVNTLASAYDWNVNNGFVTLEKPLKA